MVKFVEAVRAKYEHKEGSQEGGELVGGDKTGKKQALDVLRHVFVPDSEIDAPGDDGEVAAVCGAIEQLDLGGNKLTEWAPVQAIAVQLPKLNWLGLDRSALPAFEALPEGFGAAFGGLRTLCLSGTSMAWSQLLLIAAGTPALTEVHFSSNGLTSVVAAEGAADAASVLANVTELYLEGNALAAWADVAPLGSLPKLTLLNLNHNKLAAVPPPADGAFGSLRHLMLRGNPIEAWASVDALGGYPALCEARLAEMPLTAASSGAVARRTIIARLGKLTQLNGSEVRPRERDDAERFYLRQIATEYPEGGLPDDAVEEPTDVSDATPPVDEYGRPTAPAAGAGGGAGATLKLPETPEWAALCEKHPRWRELLLKHGVHVTRNAGVAASGGVIANELVEVTLRAISAEAAHLPAATRKLPGGLPLKSIKMIACQLFKMDVTKMLLLYTPPGQDKDIPEELDDDSQTLGYFGVVSGGTIVIDETP